MKTIILLLFTSIAFGQIIDTTIIGSGDVHIPNSFYITEYINTHPLDVSQWYKDIEESNFNYNKRQLSTIIERYFDSIKNDKIIVGYEFIKIYNEYSSMSQSLYFYSERNRMDNSYPIRKDGWIYESFSDRDKPYEYLDYLKDKIQIKYDTIIPIKVKVEPSLMGLYEWLNKEL